jgi:D-arabinose 1-dehydrogenase-like Zn-dependent alcohol dehydrogenase
MKAARLKAFGQPLSVDDVPVTRPPTGDVLVRVEAAFVPPFMADIAGGAGYTTPSLPFTPGIDAIGRIEQLGAGVRGLEPGQRVYCNPFYTPGDGGPSGLRAFIGSFALGPDSTEVLERWRDGAYAEFVLLPQRCIMPVPPWVSAAAPLLCRLGWLGTAHAALRKAAFRPAETVIVHGATGLLGASATVVALAMGAGCVQVTGRDGGSLARLAALDHRIAVIDELDTAAQASTVLSCIGSGVAKPLEKLIARLSPGGHCVIIGAPSDTLSMSLGRLLRDEITIQGSLWHQPADIEALFGLCGNGKLDLPLFKPLQFALENINEALEAPRRKGDPLSHVVVVLAAHA